MRESVSSPSRIDKMLRVFKTISRILKAMIVRCLFFIFSLVAVWRVTEVQEDKLYSLYVFTLLPLVVETIYAVKKRGQGFKWFMPGILFFLFCAVPSIWTLEMKALSDRIAERSTNESTPTNSFSEALTAIFSFSDETWTLILEQTLIFILVLAKWISPKGNLSVDQLSQLLLVNIAAGADIIELMEVFGDEKVNKNKELVVIVMGVWSWSLLQFAFVLTATKAIPDLQESSEDMIFTPDGRSGKEASKFNFEGRVSEPNVKTKKQDKMSKEKAAQSNPLKTTPESDSGSGRLASNTEKFTNCENPTASSHRGLPIGQESSTSERTFSSTSNRSEISNRNENSPIVRNTSQVKNVIVDVGLEEETCCQKSGCCDCFCFYNEVWGMLTGLMFQDGPFLMLRLAILFYYQIVTHVNIFFLCKNFFVTILILNRVRVVVKQDRRAWVQDMREARKRRRRAIELNKSNPSGKPNTSALTRNPLNRAAESLRLSRTKWVSWR